VPVSAVRGRVLFHVAHLGTVRSMISTGGVGLMLLLVGLVGYALSQLLSAWRDRRRTAEAGRAAVVGLSPAPDTLLVQLLAVTLPLDQFGGLLPNQVAVLLRMDLLDEGSDRFTLAVSREPEQVDELVSFLLPFQPVHIVRSDVLVLPACRVSDVAVPAPDLMAIDHAA
jgi:hypothetical protein